MKKSEFERILDRSFGELKSKFGLGRVEITFRARGVTTRFENTTTRAVLDYEIGEEPWLTISDLKDAENKSTLGWLLVELGIEKAPTPEQAFQGKRLEESDLAPFIQKMCEQLKEHGVELLRGDFTILPRLQERSKKYAQECKRYAANHKDTK
jgi:hypothetical protein